MEKEHYNVDESSSPDYNGNHARSQYVDPATGHATKTAGLHEAGELYGNIETAEEYGYVSRG